MPLQAIEDEETTLQRAMLPVYIVVDTSISMQAGGRIDAANRLIPAVVEVCERKPSVRDKLRLSLISLSSDAQVVVPLGRKEDFLPIPVLTPSGSTNFGSAFKLLRNEIEDGVRSLNADGFKVYRPAVFMITDGEPTDNENDRTSAFTDLTDPGFKANPHIVMCGVGEATAPMLLPYVHRNGKALIGKDGGDAAEQLDALIVGLVSSIIASTTGADDEAGFRLDEDSINSDLFDVYD